MAYFLQTAHCAVCRKTLMLQVRFARPPMPHRNAPSEHSGVPMGGGSFVPPLLRTEPALRAAPVFWSAYFPIPHRPTFGAPVFRSAYSASRNARASAASRPPSSHTMLFSPKRTCFRFAALTLRVQGSHKAALVSLAPLAHQSLSQKGTTPHSSSYPSRKLIFFPPCL